MITKTYIVFSSIDYASGTINYLFEDNEIPSFIFEPGKDTDEYGKYDIDDFFYKMSKKYLQTNPKWVHYELKDVLYFDDEISVVFSSIVSKEFLLDKTKLVNQSKINDIPGISNKTKGILYASQ